MTPKGKLVRASEEVVGDAFGPNLDRLSKLKRWYDPDNLFRLKR